MQEEDSVQVIDKSLVLSLLTRTDTIKYVIITRAPYLVFCVKFIVNEKVWMVVEGQLSRDSMVTRGCSNSISVSAL